MKKLMKAIAFTTVMCMLLSTVAFAEVLAPEIVANYKFNVSVTATADEQVALIVLREGTALSEASNETILYVDQKVAASGTASFDNIEVDKAKTNDGKVDIYAGYASNMEESAVNYKNVDVVKVKEIEIVLMGGGITVIPNAVEDDDYVGDAIAQSDKGALVYATVDFKNYNGEAITNVGWIFANGDDKRYIDYAVSGLNVLNGPVQLGVAFTNGGKDRTPFVNETTNVSLWFKVGDKELQAK